MKFKCLHLLDTNILKKYWVLKHSKKLSKLVCSICSSQDDIKICLFCNKVFCKNDSCLHTIFFIYKNFVLECVRNECKELSSSLIKNQDYKEKCQLKFIKLPNQFEIVSNILIGLPNLGNTCYLNSLIQLLINNKQFRRKIFRIKNCSLPCSLCEIKKFTEFYLNMSSFNISKLIIFLMKNNKEYMNSEQHDVYLLYLYLFDDALIKNHKKIISKLFINEGENIIECKNCKNTTNIKESFKVLSLDYCLNLIESLNSYFDKEEVKDGWNCQKCANNICFKYVKLYIKSKILVIQIKRFKNVHDKTIKINDDMEIEENIKVCGKNYKLYGFIVHIGKINFGHYISYLVKDNYFIKFDDEMVSKEYKKDVLKKAYLLFFISC